MLGAFAEQFGVGHDVEIVTYPTHRQLDFAALAELVEARLPSCGHFAIVAESFSGPVAALVASKNPDGLAAIVLVATFAARPMRLPRAIAVLARWMPMKSGLAIRLLRPFVFGRWGTRESDRLFKDTIAELPNSLIAFRLRLALEANQLADIAKIGVPIRYIRPTSDRLVSRTAYEKITSANQQVSLSEIAGPHFILQVRPSECAVLITAFIETL